MTERESEAHAGSFSAEEQLIRVAEARIMLRPSLRAQVLRRAAIAHQRGRFIASLQLVAASALFAVAFAMCGGYYISLWHAHHEVAATAEETTNVTEHTLVVSSAALVASVTEPRELVLWAISKPDDWALVDAYGALRAHRYQVLRNAILH